MSRIHLTLIGVVLAVVGLAIACSNQATSTPSACTGSLPCSVSTNIN